MQTGDTPAVLRKRSSIGFAATIGTSIGSAALVALTYVVLFSPAQDTSDDGILSALRSWQSAKSSPPSAPTPQRMSTLMVRNHSGLVNEPLELGVSIDAPGPAATVTIKGMPPGARLTAGVPLSFTEWRVPAAEVSTAMVIPPADFVGELNLSAELHDVDGAALATSFMQLAWKATTPPTAVVASSAAAPASAVPAPQPPTPQPMLQQPKPQPPLQQQAIQSPPQQTQTVAALPAASTPPVAAPTAPPADAVRELSPNEIASMVRRAQELMANGDVKAARMLLLRAAEAHDARAALSLAKTFDPIALRQFRTLTLNPGPDLAQARTWYQRAREWGSPEAQRQLDALASYR